MLFDPLVRAKPVGYSVTSTTRIPLAPSAGGTKDSEPSYPLALQPPPSKLDHLTLIKRVQGWHRLTESGLRKQAEGIFNNPSQSRAAGIRGGGLGHSRKHPPGVIHGRRWPRPRRRRSGFSPREDPSSAVVFCRGFSPLRWLPPPRGSLPLSPGEGGGKGEALRGHPGAGDGRRVEGQTAARAVSVAAPGGALTQITPGALPAQRITPPPRTPPPPRPEPEDVPSSLAPSTRCPLLPPRRRPGPSAPPPAGAHPRPRPRRAGPAPACPGPGKQRGGGGGGVGPLPASRPCRRCLLLNYLVWWPA